MTFLPLGNRDVYGVPGEEYQGEEVCSHPFCDVRGRDNLELHELWPRSFLRGQPYRYVRLPDGRVVGNQVYLCNAWQNRHHEMVTQNHAKIFWAFERFHWKAADQEYGELDPQPPPLSTSPGSQSARSGTGGSAEEEDYRKYARLSDEGIEDRVIEPRPGEHCRLCKRRVPHPKKKTSPTTKTFSYRVPIDDAEAHGEILDAAAQHIGVDTSLPHHRWHAITKLCALALQGPGEERTEREPIDPHGWPVE